MSEIPLRVKQYWKEKDSDINDDFPLIPSDDCEDTDIDESQGAIICWVVAFTAIFKTLHTNMNNVTIIKLINYMHGLPKTK